MKKAKIQKTVLVVEDESLLRKSLVSALKAAKFKVVEAKNGKEGLERALKHRPDLILLDLIMPVMDGLTMLKKLRKDEWGKNVFVYILTNSEPTVELDEEASIIPYRSVYLLKFDYDLDEVVGLVKKQLGKVPISEIK
ncbi:response regulator [Candidatus Peregrinibacteria bacterium]|nr:response regulator [Candidatus Peregrinibacteria bacterium]